MMAALQRILALNQRRRRRRRSDLVYINYYIRNTFNPLDVLSDSVIVLKYRLPRVEILHLLEIVSPQISRSTRRNFALSPEVQLLAALRYYAVGSFLEVVGDGIGLSKASVSRSVEAVTNILVRHVGAHVKMGEIQLAHRGFHAMAGIPRVIGLVDGTLIPVSNPSMDSPNFICRKGYPAINAQVVVDHNGLIVDVVAKWPGRTHDSYVWADSAVGQDAARGVFGGSYFLGDSGYPLRTYLITPVPNPATPAEVEFNRAHIRTRGLVERTIGRWKHRFRCIHRSAGGLQFKPAKCCAVIAVTAMLHNIAVRARAHLPPEDIDDEIDDGDNPPPLEDRAALHNAGFQARQNIINLLA